MSKASGIAVKVVGLTYLLLCASARAAQPAPPPVCGGVAGLPTWFNTILAQGGVYRGTLGKQSITLQLKKPEGNDDEAGGYFYQLRQTDLTLLGSHSGKILVLAEQVWGGPDKGLQITGCFMLQQVGSGLVGEWKSPAGKRSAVSLKLLKVAAQPLKLLNTAAARKLRVSSPLTFLKLNTVWPAVEQGVREPLSGVVYPRLAGASTALTAALQDRQLLAAQQALNCQSQLAETAQTGDGFTLSAEITHQTYKLISLHESAEYYCGGAHPDNFDSGLILNKQSGQVVKLTTLWPKLSVAKQLSLYLAGYPSEGADQECASLIQTSAEPNSPYPQFAAWLIPQGLNLVPNFLPHVAGACAEVVTLGYAQLRPLANLKSVYAAELYGR